MSGVRFPHPAQMKTFYFVRHGESQANDGTVTIGADAQLSEKGREQARAIAQRCVRLPIQLIISSTMRRAQETAQFIRDVIQKPTETSPLLIERRNPSEYNHLFENEWGNMNKEFAELFYKPGRHYTDGENFEDVIARAEKALAFLSQKKEDHIVVVTHGSFLRDMIALAIFKENLIPIRRRMGRGMLTVNTGLTVLQYDEEKSLWSMITWNDHAHLG